MTRAHGIRTAVALLALLSLAGMILPWLPFSSEGLWRVRAVARELWPWLLFLNVLGLILARRRAKPLLVVFIAGLGVATWPLVQIASVKRDFAHQWHEQGYRAATLNEPNLGDVLRSAFGGNTNGAVTSEALPLGIQLYRPRAAGKGPSPILVSIHGDSWQQGSTRSDAAFSSYFANRGWAVFSLEYRLAPEFQYPAQIEDVRAAIDWIYAHAGEYDADRTHIALIGRSAGGHLAMLAGYTSSVPIRAIVDYYAPADLSEVYRDPPVPDPIRVRDKLTALLGGTPTEVPAAYRDASPATYMHAAVPPTLHIQGAHDNVIQAWLTRDFHRRLLERGARSLLLELPWSDHAFDYVGFGPGSALALRYSEAFLTATVADSGSRG